MSLFCKEKEVVGRASKGQKPCSFRRNRSYTGLHTVYTATSASLADLDRMFQSLEGQKLRTLSSRQYYEVLTFVCPLPPTSSICTASACRRSRRRAATLQLQGELGAKNSERLMSP